MVIASQPAVIESPVELEGPTYLCLIPSVDAGLYPSHARVRVIVADRPGPRRVVTPADLPEVSTALGIRPATVLSGRGSTVWTIGKWPV